MRPVYRQPKERNPFKLLALLLLLAWGLWMLLSSHGLREYIGLSRELGELRAENQRLDTENQKLEDEIRRLLTDPKYIEEVARDQHGLLKKNEIMFDFRR